MSSESRLDDLMILSVSLEGSVASADSSLGQVLRVGGTVLVGTILPGVVIYVLSSSMGTDRRDLTGSSQ